MTGRKKINSTLETSISIKRLAIVNLRPKDASDCYRQGIGNARLKYRRNSLSPEPERAPMSVDSTWNRLRISH
jgi:hypothetical protein